MDAPYPDECYVRYVDACDSHTKGKVYVIAMLHDVVEPYVSHPGRSYGRFRNKCGCV